MNTINLDFCKIENYKNTKFNLKKINIIKKFKMSCLIKNNYVKKKIINNFYFNIFRQLESVFSFLPKIKNVKLKFVNKKKKIKIRSFLKVSISSSSDVFYIFENFIIKYFYFYIKNLENLKYKKYNFMKEVLKKKFNTKLKLNNNFIVFNLFYFKNFLDFSKKFSEEKKKILLFYLKFEKKERFIFKKNIKLKVSLFSKNITYFFNLIKILIYNFLKLNLYMRKKIY